MLNNQARNFRMKQLKLFAIAFIIMFISTSGLCISLQQPLIYYPLDYGLTGFLQFGVLTGFLCFCLVFINLPTIRFIKHQVSQAAKEKPFYVIITIIILQFVTLGTGYVESGLTTKNADVLYYYKGVSNSLIYVITGNFTALIIALMYAKEQVIRLREMRINFEFDTDQVNP
jgi:hypothetical protein